MKIPLPPFTLPPLALFEYSHSFVLSFACLRRFVVTSSDGVCWEVAAPCPEDGRRFFHQCCLNQGSAKQGSKITIFGQTFGPQIGTELAVLGPTTNPRRLLTSLGGRPRPLEASWGRFWLLKPAIRDQFGGQHFGRNSLF